MNLTAVDISYIHHRVETYEIKYQEVEDEITDHVLSYVETARANGDERDMEHIFDDMMDTQFPGYYAFAKIAIQYEKNYRIKIKKEIWVNFKYYLNLQNCILIAGLFVMGYYLPQSNLINITLQCCCIALAIAPVIYAHFQIKRVHVIFDKRSIVKEYIKTRAAFLLFINFNILLNDVIFSGFDHFPFLKPHYHHPVYYMLPISFSIIYSLSSMRLCRQELKLN